MKDKYILESGSEFDEVSDIAIRLKVLAGEIYSMQTSLEWLKRQLFPSSASGEYLDRFAEQRGLERRAAVKAAGTLTFRVNETRSTAVTIPRGTVISTDTEVPVRVYTTENSELPANTYSVTVAAEAEQAGYRGNINAGTATIPVSMPSEIDSVTNQSPFRGGSDEESDTTLRERIRDSYIGRPNGMNAAYYIALALSVPGIAKAGVISKQRGAGTVNVYVSGTANSTVSNEKLAEVQSIMNRERELNVDVLVAGATAREYDLDVAVTAKAGYETAEVTSMINAAFEAYLDSIPIGGRLYLSTLGKYLLDTGCIETYEFDMSMANTTAAGSKYFAPGDVNIEVS